MEDDDDGLMPASAFTRPRRGKPQARVPSPDQALGISSPPADDTLNAVPDDSPMDAPFGADADVPFGAFDDAPFGGQEPTDPDFDTEASNELGLPEFEENNEFIAPFVTFQLMDKINFALEGIPDSFVGIEELRLWYTISRVLSNVRLCVVLVSCINFAVDTLPSFWQQQNPVTGGIESTCIGFFTVELILRFGTSREKKVFFLSPMNVIDLISIIPYYIDTITRSLIGPSDTGLGRVAIMFTVLRFSRLSRVLKLSKHSTGMSTIFETFARSQAALSLMFFLLLMCLLVGATAMYFSEQTVQYFDYNRRSWRLDRNGGASQFQSIFDAFWFVIVTVTTVGYGDQAPISLLGKLCAAVLMIIGVFVISFPTVILSSNFHDIHNSRLASQDLVADKMARMAAQAEGGSETVSKEEEEDDTMDETEQARMMQSRRRKMTTRRVSYSYIEKELSTPALEYKVPDEPDAVRGIYINGYVAEYAPLLILEREPAPVETATNMTGGKFERVRERPLLLSVQPNFPVGVVVNFQLILHTLAAHQAAQASVNTCLGPAASLLTVRPRPVKRLEVRWSSGNHALNQATVVTKVFKNPVGKVTIQIYLPYFDVLPALLRYNAGACFEFSLEYEDPVFSAIKGRSLAPAIRLASARANKGDDSASSTPSIVHLQLSRPKAGGLTVPQRR